MISKQTSFRLALLNILTPEQREKVQAANWGSPGVKAAWVIRNHRQGMGPGLGDPGRARNVRPAAGGPHHIRNTEFT